MQTIFSRYCLFILKITVNFFLMCIANTWQKITPVWSNNCKTQIFPSGTAAAAAAVSSLFPFNHPYSEPIWNLFRLCLFYFNRSLMWKADFNDKWTLNPYLTAITLAAAIQNSNCPHSQFTPHFSSAKTTKMRNIPVHCYGSFSADYLFNVWSFCGWDAEITL